MTNETNNDTAKELFIKRLNESDMYFVIKDIPKNETNKVARSEEHTSEFQSRQYLVCRLLLEKKKKLVTYKYYINLFSSIPS